MSKPKSMEFLLHLLTGRLHFLDEFANDRLSIGSTRTNYNEIWTILYWLSIKRGISQKSATLTKPHHITTVWIVQL